jgi:serine/threonine-protein kinase
MGKVYLAEDLELPRKVAIKSIRLEMKENEEVLKRIKRECQMHAAIGVHPHIVALHDKIEENNNLYLIMEYVDGEPLSNFFAEKKAVLPPNLYNSTVYDIIIQVLDALSCIHRHNIIHRDIKPSNILIKTLPDNRFQAKLMDFGIARSDTEEQLALTQLTSLSGGGPGTPAYMAPERIDSQTYGKMCPATDIYSAGVILYELLSDNPPFNGTITEIFTGHLTKALNFELLKANISSGVIWVLEKSLKKYPNERYADASQMAADLKAAKDGIYKTSQPQIRTDEKTLLNTASSTPNVSNKPQGTLLDTKTGPKFDFKKDKKIWAAGGAVAVVLLLIFGIFGMKGFSRHPATTGNGTSTSTGNHTGQGNGKVAENVTQPKKNDDNITKKEIKGNDINKTIDFGSEESKIIPGSALDALQEKIKTNEETKQTAVAGKNTGGGKKIVKPPKPDLPTNPAEPWKGTTGTRHDLNNL